jgi:hypothetical protein
MPRWLIVGIAVVTGLAGGWWQWQADDAPSLSELERIAALDGVASVEYEPAHPYEVTLDRWNNVDTIGSVLTDASSILSSSDDPEAYPMMWVKVVGGEVYVDLSADAETTAAIVDTTASAIMTGFEVELTGDSLSQFTYKERNEVLVRARELVTNLNEAGVDDLASMGTLEFWYAGSRQHGPLLELGPSAATVARDRIEALIRCLRRSGADLVDAELGGGDQVIEVAVPSRSRVAPVADVFTNVYGKRHLELTITTGTVTPDGLVSEPAARVRDR